MRLIPSILAVVVVLAGCGTKTPLTLPPKAQPATAAAPGSAGDHSNKAAAERGQ